MGLVLGACGTRAAIAQNTELSVSCNPSLSYVKRAFIGQDMKGQTGTQISCHRVLTVQRPDGNFVIQFQASDFHAPAYSFVGSRLSQPNAGKQTEYQVSGIYVSNEQQKSAQPVPGGVEGKCVIYGLEGSNPKIECVAKADFQQQRTVYRIDARIVGQ